MDLDALRKLDVKSTENSAPNDSDSLMIFDARRSERLQKLSTLFHWPERDLETLTAATCRSLADRAPYLDHLHSVLQNCRISTSFSGIDTPCTAMGLLNLGVLKMKHGDDFENVLKGDPFSCWRSHNLWACEWQGAAQEELLRHPAAPQCLFSDISHFWLDSVAAKIPSLVESRRAVKTLMKQCKAATGVKLDAPCCVHNKNCTAPCPDSGWFQMVSSRVPSMGKTGVQILAASSLLGSWK